MKYLQHSSSSCCCCCYFLHWTRQAFSIRFLPYNVMLVHIDKIKRIHTMKTTTLYITPFLSLKDGIAWDFQQVQFPFRRRPAWLSLNTIFPRENTWQEITTDHKKYTPPPSPPLKNEKRDGKASKAAKLLQLHPCAGQEGAKLGPQSLRCCSNAPLPSPPAPMGWGHMDPLQALSISAFMRVVCMSPAWVRPRRMLCWTKHSSFETTVWRWQALVAREEFGLW